MVERRGAARRGVCSVTITRHFREAFVANTDDGHVKICLNNRKSQYRSVKRPTTVKQSLPAENSGELNGSRLSLRLDSSVDIIRMQFVNH